MKLALEEFDESATFHNSGIVHKFFHGDKE